MNKVLNPKIMMVLPDFPYPVIGGLERQAYELSKALTQHGMRVSVLSTQFHPEHISYEVKEGIHVYRIPFNKQSKIRFLSAAISLLSILVKYRKSYDIIHLHQHSWFALYSILLAKALGKSSIIKLANVENHGIPGLIKSKFGGLKKKILCGSDAIIAMSKQSLKELKLIDYPSTRILTTPNGIPILPATVKHINLTSQNPKADVCNVIFVGRLMAQKGIEDLLHAWSEVIKKLPFGSATLEICGTGPLETDLKMLAKSLEIDQSICFSGHVTDISERLLTKNIFVLPSLSEGNSNAILEGMRAALPVISTKVGGTPMQVGKEGQELLFTPGDVEALSEKLLLLIKNSDLRALIGQKMYERVLKYFTMDIVAQTYISAYHLLLKNKNEVYKANNPVVTDLVE